MLRYWRMRQLTSADADVRRAAVEALGAAGHAKSAPAVAGMLEDSMREVRLAALAALGQIGTERAAQALFAFLKRRSCASGQETDQARTALLSTGANAVVPLVIGLREQESTLREEAARLLGHIRDRRTVRPLASLLADRHVGVRIAAAEALGELGDASVVPALLRVLRRGTLLEREATAKSLPQLGWWPATAEEAVLSAIAREAWDEFSRIGAGALEPLCEVCRAWDDEIRRRGARALGETRLAGAVVPLCRALQDQHSMVQEEAVAGLGQIGTPEARQALAAVIRGTGKYPTTAREAAVRTLAQAAGEEAMDSLLTGLHDPMRDVRIAAVTAIVGLRSRRATDSLMEVLAQPKEDAGVRTLAARALGRIGDARVVDFLLSVLNDMLWPDGSPTVAQAVVEALALLRNAAAVPTLVRMITATDWHVGEALRQFGAVAVPPLIDVLYETDPTRRRAAVDLLAVLADRRAVPHLIRCLYDSFGEVRRAAAEALGDIAGPDAVRPIFVALTTDDELGMETLQALSAVIERCANELDGDDLLALAKMNNVSQVRQRADNWGFDLSDGKVTIDCGTIRNLALRELRRRGVIAGVPA